jgi:propionyl-CoA carboxylase alpha chain
MPLISSLLIANRGEIACRIARTCARLGIRTVAVHADADADALHVRSCDVAVTLAGNAPADTYLRIDLLIDAARRAGADAIHPGYGFLAENADFAAAVLDAGLTWVGPPPAAIAAMGSKIAAKARMRSAGVPVLPDSTVESIDEIGFPLLVKASAGGGGRGMRIVRSADDLAGATAAAEREAGAAFGDGTVFCERYVERGRHVEVQVLADRHGRVVALPERECSIQRRHQKVVEESPSPAVDETLRAAMRTAAEAAAREVGYEGAGTVEFLLAPDGWFAFLEMNTRLQVEHPVTEAVTGLDLVEWQLAVAEGRPLGPAVVDHPIDGWAVEVRLTAEDPAAGYLPATGRLTTFEIPGDVRVDTGVEAGSVISPYYDSMVAKVIAHRPTRETALRALRASLRDARIHGVTTNRDQLLRILEHPDVVAGDIDTELLARVDLTAPITGDLERAAAAAALAIAATNRSGATTWSALPSGWRNNPAVDQSIELRTAGRTLLVAYRLGREQHLTVDGHPLDGQVLAAGPTQVTCSVDGVTVTHRVVVDGATVHVDGADGAVTFEVVPRFADPADATHAAGSLVAPMPGSITRLAVAVGDEVDAGQVLVALEAMKMEHQVRAPAAGRVVEVHVRVGDQVEGGHPLLVLEEAAP